MFYFLAEVQKSRFYGAVPKFHNFFPQRFGPFQAIMSIFKPNNQTGRGTAYFAGAGSRQIPKVYKRDIVLKKQEINEVLIPRRY